MKSLLVCTLAASISLATGPAAPASRGLTLRVIPVISKASARVLLRVQVVNQSKRVWLVSGRFLLNPAGPPTHRELWLDVYGPYGEPIKEITCQVRAGAIPVNELVRLAPNGQVEATVDVTNCYPLASGTDYRLVVPWKTTLDDTVSSPPHLFTAELVAPVVTVRPVASTP